MARTLSRAVVLALVVLLASAGAVATVGTAADASVTRTGTDLVVTVDGSAYGDANGTTNAEVLVAGSTVSTFQLKDERQTKSFPIADLQLGDAPRDLRNVSVAVRANGTEVTEARLSLALLTFGKNPAVTVTDDRVVVDAKTVVGMPKGTSVPVAVSGAAGSGEVTGTVTGDGALALPLDGVRSTAGVLEPVTVDPERLGGADVTPEGATVDLRAAAETDASLTDGRLRVANPLLSAGTEYVVEVTGSNGRYTQTVVGEDGSLSADAPGLVGAADPVVTVWTGGTTVLSDAPVAQSGADRAGATILDGGTGVSIDSVSGSVERLYVMNESTYAVVSSVGNASAISFDDLRLNPNGSYTFVLDTGDGVVSAATSGEARTSYLYGEGVDGAQGSVQTGMGLPDVPGIVYAVVAGLFLGVLLVLVIAWAAGVDVLSFVTRSSGEPQGGQETFAQSSTPKRRTTTLQVAVVDAFTGDPVSEAHRVQLYDKQNRDQEFAQTDGGTVQFEVTRGPYVLQVEGETDTEQSVSVNPAQGTRRVRLELSGATTTLQVVDAETDRPVPNASVSTSEGELRASETDAEGRVALDLPYGVDSATVRATRDRYRETERTVTAGSSARLPLDVQTGTLGAEVAIDGRPLPGVPVAATPVDPPPSRPGEERTEVTREDGGVAFADVPVGEYRVATEIPGNERHFDLEEATGSVTKGGTARLHLRASFTYALSNRATGRIADLKQTVDDFAEAENHDTAIARYYGSVVRSVLETVRAVPASGVTFATVEADPDDVVAALLDAAEEATSVVRLSMTTKRNVDLFEVCRVLPDEYVEWDGTRDVEDLVWWLERDRVEHRQRLAERLEEVHDRISEERDAVATIDPALELWEQVRDAVRDDQREGAVESAAFGFVAVGLLDAIERLFDEPNLKARLERTVF